jgi:hypothetical protein
MGMWTCCFCHDKLLKSEHVGCAWNRRDCRRLRYLPCSTRPFCPLPCCFPFLWSLLRRETHTATIRQSAQRHRKDTAKTTGVFAVSLQPQAPLTHKKTQRFTLDLPAAHTHARTRTGVPDDAVYDTFEFSKFFRKNINLIASVIPDPDNDFPVRLEELDSNALFCMAGTD